MDINNSTANTLARSNLNCSPNGVFIPSVFSIPANSSITFGSNNPLIFIPDAGFNGGNDTISITGQNAGEAFCLQDFGIRYPNFESQMQARLKASPNPVPQRTEIYYEFTDVDKFNEATIEIYNLLGHVKDRKTIKQRQGKANFDLSAYSSGQYMVVLKYKGEIVEQLRLLKK